MHQHHPFAGDYLHDMENKMWALWPFGLITVSKGNKYLDWKRMIDHVGVVVLVMLIGLHAAFGIFGTGQQGVLSRLFWCATIVAPESCSHPLPSVWSQCQCVFIRYVTCVGPISLSAALTLASDTLIPASTRNFPWSPNKTTILPPDPINTLTFPRNGCVTMGPSALRK